MRSHRVITIRGDPSISLATYGDLRGWPVFAFHGTPASRISFASFEEAGLKVGARIICPDRPGIGLSRPAPLIDIASYAQDIALIADALEIERFGVLGWSCGGPYALAGGARMSERIVAVGLLAGVSSLDWSGALEGLTDLDQKMVDWSTRRPRAAHLALAAIAKMAKHLPSAAAWSFKSDLSPSDLEIFGESSPQEALAFLAEAFRQGTWGVLEDYRRWGASFGFDLAEVSQPVDIWHGDEDRMVSMEHAKHQMKGLPNATLHQLPGEGHLSIGRHAKQILESLHSHM